MRLVAIRALRVLRARVHVRMALRAGERRELRIVRVALVAAHAVGVPAMRRFGRGREFVGVTRRARGALGGMRERMRRMTIGACRHCRRGQRDQLPSAE